MFDFFKFLFNFMGLATISKSIRSDYFARGVFYERYTTQYIIYPINFTCCICCLYHRQCQRLLQ